MTLSFDFTSQEFLRDPAAGVARLRNAPLETVAGATHQNFLRLFNP